MLEVFAVSCVAGTIMANRGGNVNNNYNDNGCIEQTWLLFVISLLRIFFMQ